MRLGILGGSFDPVHYGHLLMAQYALEQLKLDRVFFLPAYSPPHKRDKTLSSFEDRLKMLEIAFGEREEFVLLPLEGERQGPSYTYDSLCLLQDQFPEAELFFLIGSDSLMNLDQWYRAQDLMGAFSFAVAPRPGRTREEIRWKIAELTDNFGARIFLLDSPYVEISSTGLRRRRQENKSLRYHLPPAVEEYIDEALLYQKSEAHR